MARNAIPAYVTNQTITAAHGNTYWRDNEAAHWVGTTAGDVDYYTGAANKSRLAIGAAGQFQKVNAGAIAPEWFRFLDREGAHATDWSQQGTTDYVPAAWKLQAGEAQMVIAPAADTATVTITYPVAFSDKPLVFVGPHEQTAGGLRGETMFRKGTQLAGSVIIDVYCDDALGTTATFTISWLAIGPI